MIDGRGLRVEVGVEVDSTILGKGGSPVARCADCGLSGVLRDGLAIDLSTP